MLCLELGIYVVVAHPQCLNFKPPFKSDVPLTFCTEYSEFGCCTWERDRYLQRKHADILRESQSSSCNDQIKAVLCQECSPYAAHLYDSEETGVEKPLPGMCTNYCQNFYSSCRQIVQFLTQDANILNSLYSITAFCDELKLRDGDYCYPDLKTNPVLNQKIVDDAATVDGCLCLEPFADQLRNALVFRTLPMEQDEYLLVNSEELFGFITRMEQRFQNISWILVALFSVRAELGMREVS